MPWKKLTLAELDSDLQIYFNWSANAIMPVHAGAADAYLKKNLATILKIAQRLLQFINYEPQPLYRGVILKQPVDVIPPHKKLQYLSFSTDRAVAEHSAHINGFGSSIMNLATRLGEHGYVIEYTPTLTEVLFHYHFFSFLPYAEAFDLLGMNGRYEVESLMKQKEVMILQPAAPFTNITKKQIPFNRSGSSGTAGYFSNFFYH
jgi:hypothetical protein